MVNHRTDNAKPGDAERRTRLRLAGTMLLLAALASICYVNADHEEFYFDSASGQIDNWVATYGVRGGVKLLIDHPLRPGAFLSFLTFSLNRELNRALGLPDFDVTTFLVVNVLIHAVNACLVFLLIRSLLLWSNRPASASWWVALASAMIFAVHPIHASSIVYILQRRGALATTFYLLSTLAYLAARRPEGFSSRWAPRRIALVTAVVLAYWAGLHSKQLAVTLPFALLMIEFSLRAGDPKALKPFLKWLVAGLAVLTAGMFVFLWSYGLFDPGSMVIRTFGDPVPWGPWTHTLTEARVFVHYWKLLILPLPMFSAIDHDVPLSRTLWEHGAWLAVLFHIVLLGGAVLAARKRLVLAATGVFWFYIALIPYVCLPQSELMVEYKTYLPSVGLMMILAEVLNRVARAYPPARWMSVVGVVTLLLMAVTLHRNRIYHSAIALWQDAADKYPNRARPHNALGQALVAEKRFDEAIRLFERAIELEDRNAEHYNNLAFALVQVGRRHEAMEAYKRAITLDADYADALANLGWLLYEDGQVDNAIMLYRRAIEADKRHGDAHMKLGIALCRLGEEEEGLRHLERAVQVEPISAEAHNNLGNALLQSDQVDRAVEHYRRAIDRRPVYAQAHHNLGVALFRKGQQDQAMASMRRALEIDPDYADAWANLGRIHARRGEIAQAEQCFHRALMIAPNHGSAQGTAQK